MSLHEYVMQQYARPVGHFHFLMIRYDEKNCLRLDAPYQRGSVWSVEQKRNLIKSILEGIPIGAVFVNFRSEDRHVGWVVDGKQRIEAIVGFMQDEFTIPTEWLVDKDVPEGFDEPDILFSQANPRFHRRFDMGSATVATYETTLPDEVAEAQLYLRINYGGVPQTQEDAIRASRVAYEARQRLCDHPDISPNAAMETCGRCGETVYQHGDTWD